MAFSCVLYKSSSVFIHGNHFSLFGSSIFYSPILLLFYGSFHVFLTIAICIYLCFAGEVLFRFLAFGFISHTTRISNKTSFLCKRLVVKKINLETIFPALQNWNVLHWTFKDRGFNLQIVLEQKLYRNWIQLTEIFDVERKALQSFYNDAMGETESHIDICHTKRLSTAVYSFLS